MHDARLNVEAERLLGIARVCYCFGAGNSCRFDYALILLGDWVEPIGETNAPAGNFNQLPTQAATSQLLDGIVCSPDASH